MSTVIDLLRYPLSNWVFVCFRLVQLVCQLVALRNKVPSDHVEKTA
jgi:hypothetical protein